jgi:hypothetical protein
MSQALGDLLADRFDEPPTEITRIKEYVQKNFQTAVATNRLLLLPAPAPWLAPCALNFANWPPIAKPKSV